MTDDTPLRDKVFAREFVTLLVMFAAGYAGLIVA